MKIYGKKSLSNGLVNFLNILILFGVIMTGKLYYNIFWHNRDVLPKIDGIVILSLLTIGVIATFLIVFDLKKILKTLVKDNPFIWENVKSLNKIAVQCFVISLCYIINILYNASKYIFRFVYIDNRGIHTETEPIIFFLAGVFTLVLAAIFKQAIKYKEENDYTV